jgi:hypothetical protein
MANFFAKSFKRSSDKEEFNIRDYLIKRYGFFETESYGVLRKTETRIEITLDFENNYLYLRSGVKIFVKINFIPKTRLVTDLIIFNALKNIQNEERATSVKINVE